MFRKTIEAAVLAVALFGLARPALADSWPTSFDFNDGVKLKIQLGSDSGPRSQLLKPYRGVGKSTADSMAITRAALAAIGDKGTPYGKIYNLVQVVDSLGFNNQAAARQIYSTFEKGLVQMAQGGEANGKLALAIHTVYRQLRDSYNLKTTEQAWHPTSKQQRALGYRLQMGKKYNPRAELAAMQKGSGAPAVDLIVSALRNDVAYALSFSSKKTGQAKAKAMFARSERDFARATAKVLLQGSSTTPSRAAISTRQGIRSFSDYGKYFANELPLVEQATRIFESRGPKNMQKINLLQGRYAQRMDQIGRRAVKLPGFRGVIKNVARPR